MILLLALLANAVQCATSHQLSIDHPGTQCAQNIQTRAEAGHQKRIIIGLPKNQVQPQIFAQKAPQTPVGGLKRLSALKYPQFGTFGLKIGHLEPKIWKVGLEFSNCRSFQPL